MGLQARELGGDAGLDVEFQVVGAGGVGLRWGNGLEDEVTGSIERVWS